MNVCWICPTYCRPQCLSNLIWCFERQTYPGDRLELVILDDANQYVECRGDRWQVVNVGRRFNSLPAKFNALVGLVPNETDVVIVAEDDDVYLPHHTWAHVSALKSTGLGFSKPSVVWSDYPSKMVIERADGRFHGSIGFTMEAFKRFNGWPVTDAPNFDQQMLSRFSAEGIADPLKTFEIPSYVFRWHTNTYHGQSQATSIDDVNWYRDASRFPARITEPQFDIVPRPNDIANAMFDGDRLNVLFNLVKGQT